MTKVGLGGLRQNRFNQYRNLLITMLLGGLWHGAKGNFVVWGGLHGLMLCAEHAAPVIGRGWRGPRLWAWEAWHWLRTMLFLLVTWVFFRAADFPTAFAILRKMLGLSGGGLAWVYTPLWFIAPAVVSAYLIGRWHEQKRRVWRIAPDALYTPALCLAVVLALLLLAPIDSTPFIYFQF